MDHAELSDSDWQGELTCILNTHLLVYYDQDNCYSNEKGLVGYVCGLLVRVHFHCRMGVP